MNHISDILENQYKNLDINCSDENANNKVLRIRLIHDPSLEKLKKNETHSQEILKQLENSILHDLSLKGILEIKKVFVKQGKRQFFDTQTGTFITDKAKEWIIETDGSNLAKVLCCEEVDFKRTITNDLIEIFQNLGIEAVRKALINELRAVLRPYDVYVNYRHIAILCDVMTQRGALTAITRHGINRVELGPLRKCSFEETVDILLEAGLFSETDHLGGITENIMVGQLAPFGTGCFDILLDIDKIKNAKEPLECLNFEGKTNFSDNENEYSEFANSASFSKFGCLSMQDSINCTSPTQTPFLLSPSSVTVNHQVLKFNNNFGNFTPGQNDPSRTSYFSFTPYHETGKSPTYVSLGNYGNNRGGFINNITTPNPYMSPQNNILSPNPASSYEPYSPIDYENMPNDHINSYYGENNLEKSISRSPIPNNSLNYTPSNYSYRSPAIQESYKNSPNFNSLNNSYYRVNTGYNKTYSPGIIIFNILTNIKKSKFL